ncbi:MAG: glycosyltransferase family 2 protein [Bacteroidota bacterium]|nr:glycosyltransferase family 2 protein [Bacteroidota bacterium]
MQNNLVSIIIPCYNAERFISFAIESVLGQTYPYWELIITDDCSSDNSANIINNYAKQDSRIKYLKTDKPSGSPTLPRNIATDIALGRYIAFLDADDIWLPSKLERQLPLFAQKDVAIVFSNHEKINEQGKRNNRIIKAPKTIDHKKLQKSNYMRCSSVVYDSEKVGKMYFKKIGHEDYLLWLDILKKGFVAKNTQTIEILYRVCKGSVSHNKIRAASWQWNILRNEEKLSFFPACYCFLTYMFNAIAKAIK